MRLAISNIAWSRENDEQVYEMLNELGVDALEIAPTRISDDNPYQDLDAGYKYSLWLKEKYNIDIVSIQSIWYGKDENLFRSKLDRDALTDYTYKAIDFASAIKCPTIVFGNPKQRNGYKPEYEELMQGFFYTIAEYAKEKNIVIAIEPNPTVYETNFLTTTEETIRFLEKINHSNLKLNLDLGAMIENNETIDSLKPKVEHIHHIHVSEPHLNPIQKRELHSRLKDLEYKGIVSIEMRKIEQIDVIKAIILYLKGILV
jgi:sugar phosphate isomerase/epimerase